jgi:hypothetical protein
MPMAFPESDNVRLWRLGGRSATTRLTRMGLPPFGCRHSGIPEPGYDDPDGASIIDPDGKLPAIDFSRVPEGKTAKNRVHIDLEVAGAPPWDMAAREPLLRAKADELVAAGATRVREELNGKDLGHIVMLDPEGNEFCVA